MEGVIRVLRAGGTLSMLLSSTDRDHSAGIEPFSEHRLQGMREAYSRCGLRVTELRPATPADVTDAHSTWGKRLGAGGKRPAWVLTATSIDHGVVVPLSSHQGTTTP
jgi:16S rRNA (adenine(1408)-N(1))-methyltransferase